MLHYFHARFFSPVKTKYKIRVTTRDGTRTHRIKFEFCSVRPVWQFGSVRVRSVKQFGFVRFGSFGYRYGFYRSIRFPSLGNTSVCLCVCQLESRTTLTSADHDDLLERMQNGGHHIQLNERTRHLVIQKLLIDYIYHQRSRQIEAIAVCTVCFKKLFGIFSL